jgi:hypothetical protein
VERWWKKEKPARAVYARAGKTLLKQVCDYSDFLTTAQAILAGEAEEPGAATA